MRVFSGGRAFEAPFQSTQEGEDGSIDTPWHSFEL